jgi:Uma2 family endonuclease
MTAQPKSSITEDVYLEQERRGTIKHEYYNGKVYAMSGASEQHNLIAMNVAASLHTQLRGRSCRAYPSDMRLKVVKTGLNTYPDFTIVCGQSEFTDPTKRDTLTNPSVIVEILSPSTERYDRGMKFQHYRTIETLKEYILISQDKHHIEKFTRQENNEWVLTEAIGLEAAMPITSIQGTLTLHDVYEQVIMIPELLPDITRDISEDNEKDNL